MTRMCTTTLKGRNTIMKDSLKASAARFGKRSPTVLDIGPGGRVAFFPAQKIRNVFVNFLMTGMESGLRKATVLPIKTFEPIEIAALLEDLFPARIHILDKEDRIIQACRKAVAGKACQDIFTFEVADILTAPIREKFDIVIAYQVVDRAGDKARALESITGRVNEGGILSISYNDGLPGFERVAPDTYRKYP